MCLCLRDKKNKESTFSLQWHLTAQCDQNCKHCYMVGSHTYQSELKHQLSFENCIRIIDDFADTLQQLNRKGTVVLGGGDPLLREDIFSILRYIQEKNIGPIAMMGNSYHLDMRTASMLKESGVSIYQISLDGLKNTHDTLRKPGSFNDALRAFKVLKDAGISPICMFTVSKLNMGELIDVIRLAANLELAAFDFDRLVPVGSGYNLKNEMIDPSKYKELLFRVHEEYTRLKKLGAKTQFGYKDNLWNLVLANPHQDIDMPDFSSDFEIVRNCIIGEAGFAVLSDGSVMGCRRLPIIIGKIPEQKLIDIMIHSPILKSLKKLKDNSICASLNQCNTCHRCLAVSYGASDSDFFACDPQCWKNAN